MKMNQEELRNLLKQKEGLKLDFKQEPHQIYHPNGDVQKKYKNELIKDILALTHGNIGTAHETAYLIFGAANKLNPDLTRDLYDIGEFNLEETNLLKMVNSACHPPIQDIGCEVIKLENKRLFVISIYPTAYLHETNQVLETFSKTSYRPGTVLIRRNESISEAFQDEREVLLREREKVFLSYKSNKFRNFSSEIKLLQKNFVGREYVFNKINHFIINEPNGYFIIEGQPGIGKSAIIANIEKYVSTNDCVPYFNKRSQYHRAEQFLENICNQLIKFYQFKYDSLPPDANKDGAFLSRLLEEISEQLKRLKKKLIIAIDALDEVDNTNQISSANLLYLPDLLPDNIYFIITQRPGTSQLYLCPNTPVDKLNLDLREYSNNNLEDVQSYLKNAVKIGSELLRKIKSKQWNIESFILTLSQKSQGNFMYLLYVLADIQTDKYKEKSIDKLPHGLSAYYERHWKLMGMDIKSAPNYKAEILKLLIKVRQPVSSYLISKWVNKNKPIVEEFLDEVKQFLIIDIHNEPNRYSIYHASFCDFLNQKRIIQKVAILIPGIGINDPIENIVNNLLNLQLEERSYLLKHLPSHIAEEIEQGEKLCNLLTNIRFIEFKLRELGLDLTIEDYNLISKYKFSMNAENLVGMRLIQEAIRLSSDAIYDNLSYLPEQLAGQLLGRLLFCPINLVKAMLKQVQQQQTFLWLQPLSCSLTPPSEFLLYTQIAHNDSIQSLAISPDGQKIISASSDNTLKVWELVIGKELYTINGHSDWIRAVAITPNGEKIVSASDDCTLKVWDLVNGDNIHTLKGHKDQIKAILITPDSQKIISASDDGEIRIWDIDRGVTIRNWHDSDYPIESLALIPNKQQFISASHDKTLQIWDLNTGKCLKILEGHRDRVMAVAVTPDGKKVVSVSEDQDLRIWDLESHKILSVREEAHQGCINAITITPDGKQAITASDDQSLIIWDLDTTNPKYLNSHTAQVNSVVVTPDGKQMISGSEDGKFKVWDLGAKSAYKPVQHNKQVKLVAVTSHRKLAVSCSDDEFLKVWSLTDGSLRYQIPHEQD